MLPFTLASEFQPEGYITNRLSFVYLVCFKRLPEGSHPPPEWKNRKGRQAFERVWPGAALTLCVKVSLPFVGDLGMTANFTDKGGLWVRFHKANS